MMDIFVIIVTLNAAKTLQRCLDSVYSQTVETIKIIIIDGNSTDDTIKILKRNSARLFYWISEPDDGIYDAMNKALLQVTGGWAYFLGADDQLLQEFSLFAASLTELNTIYYANVVAGGYKKLGYLNHYQIAKYGIYHQAMMFPAVLFSDLKYDLKYKISADYALILELAGRGVKFKYKNYIIANYNNTGISAKKADLVFQEHKAKLILRNFGFLIWLRYSIHNYKQLHFSNVKDVAN